MNKVALTNIVRKEALREVQCAVLRTLSDAVSMTAGPCGCNTMVLHDVQDVVPNEYTKDGHKTLKNIRFYDPLEESIQREILEATTYLVKTVGDGTTSLVKIICNIFDKLTEYEKQNPELSTFEIVYSFRSASDLIMNRILENGRELSLDDIYNICMISTDGNSEVSKNIKDIYDKYGLDVFIHLGISNTTDHILKSYDGLTLERGFTSPSFINNAEGQCVINNPRLYCFEDPVDTTEMISLFTNVIIQNIIEPVSKGDKEIIPTVVMAPSISRDASKFIEEVESFMYRFPASLDKPPLLVITGLNLDIDFYSDLTSLCGCKTIKKYIDPNVQKKDIEDGLAPTPETVTNWYGSADQIISDNERTTFINPKLLFHIDENGNREYSEIYKGTIEFLTSELKFSIDNSENPGVIGNLKRRLNSLKSNYVEYLIGGITVADRDSVKDLAEDAILNCRSAANYGVGYGANFEGYFSAMDILKFMESNDVKYSKLEYDMAFIIGESFYESMLDLYYTAFDETLAERKLTESITDKEQPINLRTLEYRNDVLCSINTDATILETISKLILVMFNTNQALLVSPLNNKYIRKEDI